MLLDEGEEGGRILSRMVLEGNVFPVGSRDLGMELKIATSSNKELPLLLGPSLPLFMVSTIGPDCNPERHRKLKQLPMLAQSEVPSWSWDLHLLPSQKIKVSSQCESQNNSMTLEDKLGRTIGICISD